MNTNTYIFWCSCWIIIIIGVASTFIVKNVEYQVTSSPVEGMYHRQLVTTIDSILDARFGAGCCEEDIDTISANTFCTHFGGNLLPID